MRAFNSDRFSQRSSLSNDLEIKDHERRITNLELHSNNSINSAELLTRVSNTENRLSKLSSTVSVLDSLNKNQKDIEGVYSSISSLEGVVASSLSSLSSLSASASQVPALSAASSGLKRDVLDLSLKMDDVDAQVTQTISELEVLKDKVSNLAPGETPDNPGTSPDLSEIETRLSAVELTNTAQETTLDDYGNRIESLELGGGGEGGVDLTPILNRLDSLETADGVQDVNISTNKRVSEDNTTSITALERRVDSLEAGGGSGTVDLKPITDRLDTIETTTEQHGESIGGLVTGLTNVDTTVADHTTRIEALELGGGAGGEVDLTPVLTRIAALEDSDGEQDSLIDSNDRALRTLVGTKADSADLNAVESLVEHATWGNTGLHTRVTTLEGIGRPSFSADSFTNGDAETIQVEDVGNKVRIAFNAESFLENNLVAGPNITLTHTAGSNKVTISSEGGSPAAEPTKYYILPLGGQSNMLGAGERNMPLENHPRLKQLCRFDSPETGSADYGIVTKVMSGYGDRYREFRPTQNSNLTIIPATPCLDAGRNKFYELHNKGKAGGLVSVGSYLARAILPYIPEDYGILIVDGSKGSTGFGTMHRLGTYDAEKMQASHNATNEAARWAPNSPMARQLEDRVKHCLDLNPENRLLPLIWCQGENDFDVGEHYDGLKTYFRHLKNTLVKDYVDRLPQGLESSFRIICYSSTRKMLTRTDDDPTTRGRTIYDYPIDYDINPESDGDPWGAHCFVTSRASFDNYAYLADESEFAPGANHNKQIILVRADIDCNGKFLETAAEEAEDAGGPPLIQYSADWHFSTAVITSTLPAMLLNAIAKYTNYLHYPVPITGTHTRHVRGRMGLVSTDFVNYTYDNSVAETFFPNSDPSRVYHNPFNNNPVFKAPGVTETSTSMTTEIDPETHRRVGKFSGNSRLVISGMGLTDSFSVSFCIKNTGSDRMAHRSILQGSHPSILMECIRGGLFVASSYSGEQESRYPNFMFHKHMQGAWRKGHNDWQHISYTYNARLETFNIYLNGCLIETLTDVVDSCILNSLGIGSDGTNPSFDGYAFSLRVFNRVLSAKEINTIKYMDLDISLL